MKTYGRNGKPKSSEQKNNFCLVPPNLTISNITTRKNNNENSNRKEPAGERCQLKARIASTNTRKHANDLHIGWG
jgi:hypothetical protein